MVCNLNSANELMAMGVMNQVYAQQHRGKRVGDMKTGCDPGGWLQSQGNHNVEEVSYLPRRSKWRGIDFSDLRTNSHISFCCSL